MGLFLRFNGKVILHVTGFLLMMEGAFMMTGVPFALYYCEDQCFSLLISGLITAGIGFPLWMTTKKNRGNIGKREGYVIVSLSWIVISLFGTLPYILSGSITHFTDAFFETMSGFTTTGATILTDIESVPKGILFWRSLTHWIGGMGIIVLSVAILPILGIGGMQLFVAEMPGIKYDKLHPRITDTAKRLWGIYVALTFAETLLLLAGGMSLFDSLSHAFATMATGGFSTKNDSIAGFSGYIQYVIIIFMLFAGTNFTLHYLGFRGRIRDIWRNEEYRYYIGFTLGFAILIAVLLVIKSDQPPAEAFRDSLFQVVSIVTTTGFITTDYLAWPSYLWYFIFLLMFIGGSAGSTAGGIKIARQILLLKNSALEMKRLIHPQAIIPVRFNGRTVSQDVLFKVMAFFLFYLLIFFGGTIVMSLFGMNFETAVGSTIATLGNIGPGIGMVGPVDNYAFIPDAGKWFLSFLMLLGRLELFTIIILLSPSFWKK